MLRDKVLDGHDTCEALPYLSIGMLIENCNLAILKAVFEKLDILPA